MLEPKVSWSQQYPNGHPACHVLGPTFGYVLCHRSHPTICCRCGVTPCPEQGSRLHCCQPSCVVGIAEPRFTTACGPAAVVVMRMRPGSPLLDCLGSLVQSIGTQWLLAAVRLVSWLHSEVRPATISACHITSAVGDQPAPWGGCLGCFSLPVLTRKRARPPWRCPAARVGPY